MSIEAEQILQNLDQDYVDQSSNANKYDNVDNLENNDDPNVYSKKSKRIHPYFLDYSSGK